MKIDATSLTNENAAATLARGLDAIAAGDAAFDLSSLAQIDSSAVATLLAWQRAARAQGKSLQLIGVPAGVRGLAELYGVEDLIGVRSDGEAAVHHSA
jgi:phospholipid transport system transporter-binding protein